MGTGTVGKTISFQCSLLLVYLQLTSLTVLLSAEALLLSMHFIDKENVHRLLHSDGVTLGTA